MDNYLIILEAIPEGRILGFDMEFLMELGIQLINTLILTLFLAKFLYKPVRKFMLDRVHRISEQILAASSAEHMALSLKVEYENKLRDIELERSSVLDSANRRAQEKSEQLLSEARQNAEMILARANRDLEMEHERVKDDMKRELINLSTLLAGRFAAVSLDRQAQDRLIAEAISDMGDIKWLK